MSKKIKIITFVSLFFSFLFTQTHAIKVVVTEKIPGANCQYESKNGTQSGSSQGACQSQGEKKSCRIVCDAKTGMDGFLGIMGGLIRYFTYLAGLGGVLFLVINGIMYSMGGADEGLKGKAKENIVKSIIGLVVLLLSGVILNIIAPWVYK